MYKLNVYDSNKMEAVMADAEMPSQPVKEEPKRGGILTIAAEAVPLLAAGGCMVWIDRRRRH